MTMTVESALNAVRTSVGRLREAVRELVLTAVEDRPRGTEVHLVTQVHDAALDLAAEAEHATAALQPGGQPTGQPTAIVLAKASHAVADCQAYVNVMGGVLVRELATPERLSDLAVFSRSRGREAGAWANEIVRCIESCQQLLWADTQPALLGYWRELADVAGRTCAPHGDADRRGRTHPDA
jgi:hypothetical protein